MARVSRQAALALVLLASPYGCAEEGPSLSAGTLSYRVSALYKAGCSPDELTEQVDARTVALDAPVRSEVAIMRSAALFGASSEPASRTLTFTAGVDRQCGNHCNGGSATVAFLWEGTLTLPETAPEWDVRVAISSVHTTPDRPNLPHGTCVVETPWRSPIVIDAPGNRARRGRPRGRGAHPGAVCRAGRDADHRVLRRLQDRAAAGDSSGLDSRAHDHPRRRLSAIVRYNSASGVGARPAGPPR